MRVRCGCLLVLALSYAAARPQGAAATDSSNAADDSQLKMEAPTSLWAAMESSTARRAATTSTINFPPFTPTPTLTTSPPPTTPTSTSTDRISTPTPTGTWPQTTAPPSSTPNDQPLGTDPPANPTTPPPTTDAPTPPPPTATNRTVATTAPPTTDPAIPAKTPTHTSERVDTALVFRNRDASSSKADLPSAKADLTLAEASLQQASSSESSAKYTDAPSGPANASTPRPTDEVVDTYRRNLNSTRPAQPQSGSRDRDEYQAPRVVGGREDRIKATNESDSHEPSDNGRVSRVYHVFTYLVSLSAVGSVLLLLFFHSLAVDDRFDWSSLSVAPNTWEFAVFVAYVQHLLSISQLELVKAPYSLWTMLDGLSWAGFLPYHSSTSAITIADQGTSRRLDTILLSGVVAFADRVGVKEIDLLVRSTMNIVIFLGGLLVLFFILAAVAKRQMDYRDSMPPGYTQEDDARIASWSKISMKVCGLLVLLWLFALYPLSAMASYEVGMEVRADTYAAGPLLLAVITLPLLCVGGLLSLTHQVVSSSDYELREPFRFILWGCVYADYTHDKRAFLIAPVLLQIASGIVVGCVASGSVQASVLIALHVVFLLAALATKPFVSGSVAPWFIVALSLVKIANLSLALSAFTTSSSLSTSTRASVADTIIYLNALLVFCWFMRHVMMLAQAVRCLRDGRAQRVHDFGVHSQSGDVEEQYDDLEANMFEPGAFSHMGGYK